MITLVRTNADHPEFVKLVSSLDKELALRDGDDHDFYHQFNGIENIQYVVMAYKDDEVAGCGAIKKYSELAMEIKRMFVPKEKRGLGIAVRLLTELEAWSADMGYTSYILETGINQPEAIALYRKCGYSRISNYGQYESVDNSLCFRKTLIRESKLNSIDR